MALCGKTTEGPEAGRWCRRLLLLLLLMLLGAGRIGWHVTRVEVVVVHGGGP